MFIDQATDTQLAFGDELWRTFGCYADGDLDALTHVLAARDVLALKNWMHRMRGALLVLKCTIFASRCHEIELRCERDSQWSHELAKDSRALAAELRELVCGTRGPALPQRPVAVEHPPR